MARGEPVRCLVRPGSRRDNLDGLDVEIASGDLCDASTLGPAVAGCDAVYHFAADYRLYARDPPELYAVNVDGTLPATRGRRGGSAPHRLHLERRRRSASARTGRRATESTPVTLDDMIGHYKRSKFQGEQVLGELAREGAQIVIVNPSTPVGERHQADPDRPHVVDFLNRRCRPTSTPA